MPAPRPASYLNWVPTNNPAFIQTPSGGQLATGWLALEMPPFQYLNWITNLEDQWIQYLDQALTALLANGALLPAASTVLATAGNVAIGSKTLTALASVAGVLPGHRVSGTGIPAGTIVLRLISSSSVAISRAGTSNQVGTAITFAHDFATGARIQDQLDELDAKESRAAFTTTQVVTGPVTLTLSAAADTDENKLLRVFSAGGAVNVQLPEPVDGYTFFVKDCDGQFSFTPLTLRRFGSEKIETVTANYLLESSLGFYRVWSDGTDWFIAAAFSNEGDTKTRQGFSRYQKIDALAGADPIVDLSIAGVLKWAVGTDHVTGDFYVFDYAASGYAFFILPSGESVFYGNVALSTDANAGSSGINFKDTGAYKWQTYNDHATGNYTIRNVVAGTFPFYIQPGTDLATVKQLRIDTPAATDAVLRYSENGTLKWNVYNYNATNAMVWQYAGAFTAMLLNTLGELFVGPTVLVDGGADVGFTYRKSGASKWQTYRHDATDKWAAQHIPTGFTPLVAAPDGSAEIGTNSTTQIVHGAHSEPDHVLYEPTVAGAVAFPAGKPGAIFDPVNPLAYSITLPAAGSLLNGQRFWLAFGGSHVGSTPATVALLAGAGTAIDVVVSLTTQGQAVSLIYNAAKTRWYVTGN